MAGLSMFSTYDQQKAQAEEADRLRVLEIQGAKDYYASVENATYLNKAAAKEATVNAQVEVMRAGAATKREASLGIQEGQSTLVARGEGITAGRSAGRQMVAYDIEANKQLNEIDSTTTSMINQLVDQKDKVYNDSNMQLLNAYDEMATVLTTPGSTSYRGRSSDMLMSGISGGLSGLSLGLKL